MTEPRWVLREVVLAVHSSLLAEHGGGTGVRDENLLESALSRPVQKFTYDSEVSIFDLAAAYSYGIARNHPFVDGNKRTAFTVGALFLERNGHHLSATEVDATVIFQHLAAGTIEEEELALWYRENSTAI